MNRNSSGSTLHLVAIGVLLLGILAGAFFLLRSGPQARELPGAIETAERTASTEPSGTRLSEPEAAPAHSTAEAEKADRVALDRPVAPAAAERKKKKVTGPWITGRAVDPYGNAVANAWITVSPWSQMAQTLAMEQMGMGSSSSAPPKNSVATDSEGKFKIHRRKKLGAEIALSARGRGFLVTRDRRVLTSSDNEDCRLDDLVLDPGIVIRGTVFDHEGAPVAGAMVKRGKGPEGPLAVAAGVLEEMGMSGGGGVETDEEGVFELPYEEPGPYTLTANHDLYPEVSISGETPTHGTLDGLALRFPAPAKITGKIVGMPDAVALRLQKAANLSEEDEDSHSNKMFVSAKLLDDNGDPTSSGGGAPMMGFFNGLGGEQNEVQADGTFEIAGLRPGARYQITAFRKGGFMQREDCTAEVKVEAPTELVELPFDAGSTLTFRVVDARNSNPIERMEVSQSWEGGENFLADIMNSMGGPAEAGRYPGGRVTLEELRPPTADSLASVTIEAPGYTSLTKSDILVPKNNDMDLGVLRLQPAPVLRVQVLEAGTGKPLSRIRVSFAEEKSTLGLIEGFDSEDDNDGIQIQIGVGGGAPRGMDMSDVFGDSVRGKTDQDGMVELTVFPTSRGVLRLKSTRYAPKQIDGIVITKNSGTTTMTETISRGAEVVVYVLDEQGEPAPGVPIQHKGPEGLGVTDMVAKKTNKKGRVKYTRLAPGEHSFRVVEHGVDMGQGTISVSDFSGAEEEDDDWTVLQLTDGQTRDLRLEPPVRARLEGTIRTSAGPLVGASVSLQLGGDENEEIAAIGGAWGDMLASGGLKGRTNGDGIYKIERIPIGDYSLVVRHPDRAVPERFSLKIGRGENQFNARLAGGAITGRVLDDTGQAIAGAKVRVRRAGDGIDWSDLDDMTAAFGNILGSGGAEVVTTAADGSYRFDGLPEDSKLRVNVRAEGHVPGKSSTVKLGRDEVQHDVDVVLTRGGSIRIRVVGQDTPFLRARARYQGDEKGVDRNRSAFVSDGVAVIKGVHPGPWTVDVDAPMSGVDSPSEEVFVTSGNESEVTIER